MTTKECTVYTPRFDFGSNLDPNGKQTGTVKELLEELNYEKFKTITGTDAKKSDSNGTSITYDSLDGVFAFLGEVADVRKPKLAEDVPLSTLKTFMLYIVSTYTIYTQLFLLLMSPTRGGMPTLEFYTTETASRNQKGIAIVDHLLSTLSKEVDPFVLRRIDTSFLTYPKLLECIARENIEILEPIYIRHSGRSNSIAEALTYLAEAVERYTHKSNAAPSRPLHEAIYTYVRILPFLNFVGEYQKVIELSQVDGQVNTI